MTVGPVALGYLRLHTTDPPETALALTTELQQYAEQAHLALADVFTDLFDPPDRESDRTGFCALMDAIRRHNAAVVIIPTSEHLSRHPARYRTSCTIIETETGAQLLFVHPS